jgi:hypothetical protein
VSSKVTIYVFVDEKVEEGINLFLGSLSKLILSTPRGIQLHSPK